MLSDLKKIFENITSFLRERELSLVLDITGGEPFLYREWERLLDYIYSSSSVEKAGIITNGLFLNDKILKCLNNYPGLHLKFSAEGTDEKTYESFRGKGTFQKFIKNLELIKESSFEKTLMFTLLNINPGEVEKLFHFCTIYGIDSFIIERFIPWGMGSAIRDSIITPDKWIKTIKTLVERVEGSVISDKSELYSLLPYKGFMVKREGENFELYGAPCITGKDGIAIMPDGTVFPCRRFPKKIGNLLVAPLEDIWKNSRVLKKLRDKKYLKGKCKSCEIKDCAGCRALSFSITGDFLEEDPLCFYENSL